MAQENNNELAALLLALVPSDGSAIGNKALLEAYLAAGKRQGAGKRNFETIRQSLIDAGKLAKGKGRGGSVRRAGTNETPGESGFTLQPATPPEPKSRATVTPAKQSTGRKRGDDDSEILSYRHGDKRLNNPEVGMVESRAPVRRGSRASRENHRRSARFSAFAGAVPL